MARFSIGSDPEFMLVQDGIFHSAIGIVPGDKDDRHVIGKHEFYYDNVLAECAIAAARSKSAFISNIQDCLTKYANLVAPYQLFMRAAEEYPKKELRHPEAKKIGCDPEICTYSLCQIKPNKKAFAGSQLRTAGGHIHLGAKIAKEAFGCYSVVRMLDLFLALPAIYIEQDPTAKLRKKWYGRAGRFRQPEHGVEYRTLSNFWLASPTLVSLVYDVCSFVLKYVEDGRHEQFWTIDTKKLKDEKAWEQKTFTPASCHRCHGYNVEKLRTSIDTMNRTTGKEFMELVQKEMPPKLFQQIEKACQPQQYDLYKEWDIKLS
jgi:hypothetical protein